MKEESVIKVLGLLRLASEDLESAQTRLAYARRECAKSPTLLIPDSIEKDITEMMNDIRDLSLKLRFENKR